MLKRNSKQILRYMTCEGYIIYAIWCGGTMIQANRRRNRAKRNMR